jgi:4-oxalocrotonate tautomerase
MAFPDATPDVYRQSIASKYARLGWDSESRYATTKLNVITPAHSIFSSEVKSMPLIQVKVIEGVFSDEQKREMIRKLTDAMVSIEGENMRPVTWVVIEDVKSGEWGIGGNPLTTADVKNLAAGTKAA